MRKKRSEREKGTRSAFGASEERLFFQSAARVSMNRPRRRPLFTPLPFMFTLVCDPNRRLREHVKECGGENYEQSAVRLESDIAGRRSKFTAKIVRFPKIVDDRIEAAWWVWERRETETILAFKDIDDCDDSAAVAAFRRRIDLATQDYHKHVVWSKTKGVYRISECGPRSCKLELVQHWDAGGSIAQFVVEANIMSVLGDVEKARVKFERNGKVVDEENRVAFKAPPAIDELTEDQTPIVARCLEMEDGAGTRGIMRYFPPLSSPPPPSTHPSPPQVQFGHPHLLQQKAGGDRHRLSPRRSPLDRGPLAQLLRPHVVQKAASQLSQ